MKSKNYHLIFLLVILLISGSSISAQESAQESETTIRIVKNGKETAITDVLTEVGGKKFLMISKGSLTELIVDTGVRLKSSKPEAVEILNGNILKGKIVGGEAEITAEKDANTPLTIKGVDKLTVKVTDEDVSRQIIAQSTFLSYKTVRDNFGKKFAKSYFVIQVDIRNETLNKQFIVQTLDVLIDPNQCWNGRYIYEGFDYVSCLTTFKKYFIFPTAQQGTRREEVIATGKADLNRSNRNVGFRILAFAAGMGTILTGFNGVLGPDGVKGVNVLGTTVTAATNGLFPNNADEKLENLKNAVPTEDVIIKSKESKTFNIFIPTERVFYRDSWNEYIKPPQDSSRDTFTLKSVLDLLLLSSATGVLVDNDAPKVQVKSDDNLQNQKDKFNIVGAVPKSFVVASREANRILAELEAALAPTSSKVMRDTAEKTLRGIVTALLQDKDIEKCLKDKQITAESGGTQIITNLRLIRGEILQDNSLDGEKQDALVNKINETIIELNK